MIKRLVLILSIVGLFTLVLTEQTVQAENINPENVVKEFNRFEAMNPDDQYIYLMSLVKIEKPTTEDETILELVIDEVTREKGRLDMNDLTFIETLTQDQLKDIQKAIPQSNYSDTIKESTSKAIDASIDRYAIDEAKSKRKYNMLRGVSIIGGCTIVVIFATKLMLKKHN